MELKILQQLLQISNLSQRDFAEKTAIPESRISEWLNKKRNPKLSSLIIAGKKLGLKLQMIKMVVLLKIKSY